MFKKDKLSLKEARYLREKHFAKYLWIFILFLGVILLGISLYYYILTRNINIEKERIKNLAICVTFLIASIFVIIFTLLRKKRFKKIENEYFNQLSKEDVTSEYTTMFKKDKLSFKEARYLREKYFAKYYWPIPIIAGLFLIISSIYIAYLGIKIQKYVEEIILFGVFIFSLGVACIIFTCLRRKNFKKIEKDYFNDENLI